MLKAARVEDGKLMPEITDHALSWLNLPRSVDLSPSS
jgi:hypothetical protein